MVNSLNFLWDIWGICSVKSYLANPANLRPASTKESHFWADSTDILQQNQSVCCGYHTLRHIWYIGIKNSFLKTSSTPHELISVDKHTYKNRYPYITNCYINLKRVHRICNMYIIYSMNISYHNIILKVF